MKLEGFNNSKYLRKIKILDTLFRRCIILSGIAIIACVLAILVVIVYVAIPLFYKPTISKQVSLKLNNENVLHVGIDDRLEWLYRVLANSDIEFTGIQNNKNQVTHGLFSEQKNIVHLESYKDNNFLVRLENGNGYLFNINFKITFEQQNNKENKRIVNPEVNLLAEFETELPNNFVRPQFDFGRQIPDEGAIRVLIENKKGFVIYNSEEEDFLGNTEKTTIKNHFESKIKDNITQAILSKTGDKLFLFSDQGYVEYWDLSDPEDINLVASQKLTQSAIVNASFILGDISFIINEQLGKISSFFYKSGQPRSFIHSHSWNLERHKVIRIIKSLRNKSFFVQFENKKITAYHLTSEKQLLSLTDTSSLFALNSRLTTMATINTNQISIWNLNIPHPETSFKALFSKVFYESYPQKDYIWQSSGSDDTEPKFSLIPLIFGSIKGTLYALLLAVPIAVFAAVYTNRFSHPSFKKIIKPIIELMASIPSVVIGYLAAFWLAPFIENFLFGTVVFLFLFFTLFFILFFTFKNIYYSSHQKREGYEFLYIIPLFFIVGSISYFITPSLENILFDGNIKQWFFDNFNIPYDQRNAIVISFALGFTIIPIIYTITDDALDNVPKSLIAASLALGASHWQTTWKVVLPMVSAGIFSALIIGFGRAIGETMIVLMATGNTPIIDWSLFNGMRTLSANIAVEIPEAPKDGTLYRILFLSASLLFILTFIINTASELIRQSIRKKYSALR